MAVKGDLKDISLASLISINCNEMKQARLRVMHEGQQASLFFDGGNVVHAVLGTQVGEEPIYEVLTWEEGEFELQDGVASPQHTVTTGWSGLVMEGARRIDERASAVPEFIAPVEEPHGPVSAQDLIVTRRCAEGVTGVVIVATDGTVLAHDLDGESVGDLTNRADGVDPDQEGAIAVFVGNAARQIGEALALGAFQSGVVQGSTDQSKMLVLNRPDYYVGLLLAERASPALVATSVAGLLR